ncbi:MAG: chloride channel protein [Flavobacteriaceae bacterium]
MTDTSQQTFADPALAGAEADERTVSLTVLCLLALLIGVVAAAGAVVFRFMISLAHNVIFLGKFGWWYDANQYDPPSLWGPLVVLSPVVGGLIVVWLVKTFAPEAKGHGVPEVMYAVYHKGGDVRGVVAIVKSIASAISIGSGASVGREGPIIQIGASFGSTLARKLSLPRWQKITLLSAGAGAGIAATFNTPLGGVLFAVELLLPEVSNRTFLPVVVATTTATYIGRIAFGLDPAFNVPVASIAPVGAVNVEALIGFAVLGVLGGIASWAFVKFLAWCEDFFPAMPGNDYTRNIIGMLIIGLMSYGFFVYTGAYHAAGVGYATIQDILDGGINSAIFFIILLLAKLLATSISLGAGASGGVFSPSLFIGATLGGAVGAVGAMISPNVFSVEEFAVVGMGTLVGGATGASMTAIVMIFEMTRDYNVIVPLVLAVALAVGVRRALVADNIYTVKLRNRGKAIPLIRHTNMYLVQQARELMSKNFAFLPADTPVTEAIDFVCDKPGAHVIVTDNQRIIGYVRFGSVPYRPAHDGQTLRSLVATDYVVAPENNILNSIITRMNTRKRSFAIILKAGEAGVPRAEDIVGVIDAAEIAGSVVRNHYA